MSDTSSQGLPDLSAFLPAPDGQQGDTGQQQETGQGDASLSNDFLSNVPENDRAVVGRYIKDWDSNVTRRFQEIHNQYAPYKELGDVDHLKQAIEVYDLLDNSPEVVYETLRQHFAAQMQQGQPVPPGFQGEFQQNQQLPAQPQPQPNPQLVQAMAPMIAPLTQQIQQQQEMMEKMAQVILMGDQKSQEAAEDKALDDYLAELETRHGKFDQRAILMGLYEGKDGDTAVKEWKESLTQYMPQHQNQIPPPLTGGSIPNDQVDVGAMSSSDVKNLTASVFQALANQQQ